MKVSLRDEKAVQQVIDLCQELEERAALLYQELVERAESERLRSLWSAMRDDERDHRAYWVRLKEACATGAVPEVFEEPRRYVDELVALQARLGHLAVQARAESHAPRVFIHALRLEFLLLHPAVVTLFHYLPDTPEALSPRHSYEQHLGRLLNALMEFSPLPPEFELLGEMIGQVWRKSAESTARAVTDPVTGLLNRRGLYIAMRPLASLARREKAAAGILLVEISNLKELNRAHGYKVGDLALRETAAAITARLRSSDVTGRFGGDDFLVLLTRFAPEHLPQIGGELVERVGRISIGRARPRLTVGGAHAVIGRSVARDLEALVRAADGALLEAREAGRGCIVRAVP